MERIDTSGAALGHLPRERLEAMAQAGAEVRECQRVLKKGGLNPVKEMLRGVPKFVKLDHYPKGDVYDRDSHAQYYYHAHRGAHEHGHFHTFLRAGGMPEGVRPVPEAAGPRRRARSGPRATRPSPIWWRSRWTRMESRSASSPPTGG